MCPGGFFGAPLDLAEHCIFAELRLLLRSGAITHPVWATLRKQILAFMLRQSFMLLAQRDHKVVQQNKEIKSKDSRKNIKVHRPTEQNQTRAGE